MDDRPVKYEDYGRCDDQQNEEEGAGNMLAALTVYQVG
jgi:hypothetical protein